MMQRETQPPPKVVQGCLTPPAMALLPVFLLLMFRRRREWGLLIRRELQ